MFELNTGKLKIAANYHVTEPIKNFKLRLKIIQQKSLLAELFESEGETRDTNFLVTEERIFNWQEKVFSAHEIKYYEDKKNCINDVHKEYHNRIVDDNIEGSRLFTYTENDSYYHDKNPVTKNGYKSILSLKNEAALPAMINKKPFNERYNKKVIDLSPTDSTIRTNHYLYQNKKIMYIMVDLTSKDQALTDQEYSEILLCTISYDEIGKILTVDPDFINNECYTIEATGISYDYWIEHVSDQPNDREIEIRNELLHHEIHENQLYRETQIFSEIQLPLENIFRLYLTLDICEAHGFAYNSLFLTYSINLPKYWSTNQRDCLSGRTQRCQMIDGRAHFSYVTEISLDFDLNCLINDSVSSSWPHLIITASSLDKWSRYRIEGYTSIPLPSSSGSYVFQLKTWRPVAGLINSLRRFFTGGTAELEDLIYCAIPREHDGKLLDKTQLNVVPSGTIEIRMNIIQQSKQFMKNRGPYKDVLNRLSAGTLMTSVDNVLEQFKAARERMLHARAMSS
ncbi:hypothetical protein PV326_009112 [Microctonus aethiopoides]|nr:hypothetical protein PV326_009112 [Microctonus aethiopoides]